tara:strand:+ start:1554 stop:2612 length:1059 start_codon:yes stop_codon:yes gene_type:complete
MNKYYTRACNFYYGSYSEKLIKKKLALPLCGNKLISFDKIELITRNSKGTSLKVIGIKNINSIKGAAKKKVKKDIKNITSKRRNFLKNINFSKPSIMGILNLTPDSFSDGGLYNKKSSAEKHIKRLINSGADIIDVGGESTRPGSKTIPIKTEWRRIEHVIKNFKKKFPKICLSLDTRKSEIMKEGYRYKVNIMNDVSGFEYDPLTLSTLKKMKISKVVHHMQGTPNTMQKNPKYKNVLLDIYDFFEKKINSANDKMLILDPGIGFGKTLKHNLTLISKISLFHSLGLPILVGSSRKRFISQLSKVNDSKERLGGTLASVLFLLSQGVQMFRVHDVNEIKQGILVFNNILKE